MTHRILVHLLKWRSHVGGLLVFDMTVFLKMSFPKDI